MPQLDAEIETWPIEGEFVIARGAKREATVVVASICQEEIVGRGECVPYPRYGEEPQSVLDEIIAQRENIARGITRAELRETMPPCAARNAIDCAMWDLEAKASGQSAARLAGFHGWQSISTSYTLSLGTPEEMAARARWAREFPVLKIKLGGDGDIDRLMAVRAAVPEARLTIDANEAWKPADLARLFEAACKAGVELIEQPLPAGDDAILAEIERPIAICADETCHTTADLPALATRYDAINIKLDKAGGLTEALEMARTARTSGLKIMVGCMVSTSLAMAPAMLLAQNADWVDLDGPLLLVGDRTPGLDYNGPTIAPPPPSLWG